ncbi:hypothetical protein T265_02006 [Opisthorchis viverrini]|uniref:Uncharacterized protein n=1 Tax=Opisthorchis viverrini TaxID=6198 RepID=A0A074ZXG4_OPIVI|nr:hypothetical protein T265_02006 [Opisthorchis viverrini]KER31771.1 hypothetical protein T265_02006 [Opisthorchis viverrini]
MRQHIQLLGNIINERFSWVPETTYGIPQKRGFKWLEREFTDRKVRGSNPAYASRLSLSRLWQPGSIQALVLPSGGTAARHRKGATAEQLLYYFIIHQKSPSSEHRVCICLQAPIHDVLTNTHAAGSLFEPVRGSNPAYASRLSLSRLWQPGSIQALVLPSGGTAARHRKGATAEQLLYYFIIHQKSPSSEHRVLFCLQAPIHDVLTNTHAAGKLLIRLLKTLRQPTTGFALLGAHQVSEFPSTLSST